MANRRYVKKEGDLNDDLSSWNDDEYGDDGADILFGISRNMRHSFGKRTSGNHHSSRMDAEGYMKSDTYSEIDSASSVSTTTTTTTTTTHTMPSLLQSREDCSMNASTDSASETKSRKFHAPTIPFIGLPSSQLSPKDGLHHATHISIAMFIHHEQKRQMRATIGACGVVYEKFWNNFMDPTFQSRICKQRVGAIRSSHSMRPAFAPLSFPQPQSILHCAARQCAMRLSDAQKAARGMQNVSSTESAVGSSSKKLIPIHLRGGTGVVNPPQRSVLPIYVNMDDLCDDMTFAAENVKMGSSVVKNSKDLEQKEVLSPFEAASLRSSVYTNNRGGMPFGFQYRGSGFAGMMPQPFGDGTSGGVGGGTPVIMPPLPVLPKFMNPEANRENFYAKRTGPS